MLDLLEGKVSAEARRVAAYACGVVAAQEVASALGWLATADAAPGRGARRRARAQPHGVAPASRRVRHRRARGHVEPGARVARGRPLPLRADRRGNAAAPCRRSPIATSRWRPARAWWPSCSRARSRRPRSGWSATWWPAVGPGTSSGTLDFLVEITAQARGWRIARVTAGGAHRRRPAQRAVRVARHAGRRAGRVAGRGRRVVAERGAHPHRRSAGGRHRAGSPRGPAGALDPGRLGAVRVRPARPKFDG